MTKITMMLIMMRTVKKKPPTGIIGDVTISGMGVVVVVVVVVVDPAVVFGSAGGVPSDPSSN